MRLQVFLSQTRVCSRRKAMELVQSGQVSVNGLIVREPAYAVTPGLDKVSFKGRQVLLKEKSYLLLYKPKGFVTTLYDTHARRTVMDLLPPEYKHLYPVGRLDKDSEGLLLFTSDGDLTFRLLHPSFKVDKAYYVEIDGFLVEADRARLEKGIMIEGRRTHPAKIKLIYANPRKSAFQMIIHEGRKRQIRLMLGSAGYKVTGLRRIGYGPLSLGNLKAGRWRVLDEKEVQGLRKACGMSE